MDCLEYDDGPSDLCIGPVSKLTPPHRACTLTLRAALVTTNMQDPLCIVSAGNTNHIEHEGPTPGGSSYIPMLSAAMLRLGRRKGDNYTNIVLADTARFFSTELPKIYCAIPYICCVYVHSSLGGCANKSSRRKPVLGEAYSS